MEQIFLHISITLVNVALKPAVGFDVPASAYFIMDELPSRAPPTIPDTKLSIPSQILDGGIIHDTIMEVKSNFSADSHAMAQTDYGAVGAVQTQPKTTHAGVRDIGWHRPASKIPDPLIGELPNEKLFAMMRRFNKVGKLKNINFQLTVIRMSSMFKLYHQMLPVDSI